MTWLKAGISKIALAIAIAASIGSASASVVMSNTRVVYAGNTTQQNVQFTNQDPAPSVMQVWVDAGNPDSTPETADAPFIVTPPVFRIEPKAGQTVRIVFTGKALPSDRESLFYLNTLQIPSIDARHADQNQMLVMLRSRLKLFYRPAGMVGDANKAAEKLGFRLQGDGANQRVTVNNPTGYYVSLIDGEVTNGARTAGFKPDMLEPRSEMSWNVHGNVTPGGEALRVKVSYVDDHGAVRKAEYPVLTSGQEAK